MVTSPQKMAQVQNEYYINKVREIRKNMPRKEEGPPLYIEAGDVWYK